MLSAEDLKKMLVEVQREVNLCRPLCYMDGTVTAEPKGYDIYHNGIGSSDTDHQIVSAGPTLDLGEYGLKQRLVTWLKAVHDPQGYHDLHA